MSEITIDLQDRRDMEYQIFLTLRAPILSRSVSAAGYGLDAPAARDHQNRIYLPGALIKGCLLEALNEIKDDIDLNKAAIHRWFGQPSPQNTYNTALRGCLEFSDFITTAREDDDMGFRIRIDADRGAVARGALLALEMPFKPGREVTFYGVVRCVASGKEADAITDALLQGLRWTPALGGLRGVGFGQITRVEVSANSIKSAPSVPAVTSSSADRLLMLVLYPQGPFCLSRHTPVPNLFDSEHVISGAVIKGVIANTLNRWLGREPDQELKNLPPPWKELGEQFHKVHVKHAFPVERRADESDYERRPVVPPLSTVIVNKRLYDVALQEDGAGLIDKRAPAFSVDWKWQERQSILEQFGWPTSIESEKEMRVRTKMNAATRRAEDNMLFAVKRIIPDRFEWISAIDFKDVDSGRDAVRVQLETILNHGLIGFSRSKVRVVVKTRRIAPKTLCRTDANSVYVVMLQTQALMIASHQIAGPQIESERTLKQAYEAYWQDVSEGALVQERFFARQVLKGRYLFYHFNRANTPYNPIPLTDEGSVFILKAASGEEGRAQATINQWMRNGLPLPGWARSSGSPQNYSAWHPANGFGEIKVNLNWHVDKRPQPGQWEGLMDGR